MIQRIIILLLMLISPLSLPVQAQSALFGASSNNQFVSVDQAFAFDFQQKDNQLQLSWQIRPGYYLYRQQLKFSAQQAQLGPVELPAGEAHRDEFYGDVAIYRDMLTLNLPLLHAEPNAQVSVTYQGCAAAGFCYPPETRVVPLRALQASLVAPPATTVTEQIKVAPVSSSSPLPFSPFWALLFGIAIAFTPCVLPMYPLISSLILGREKQHSSGRILLLALVYVQGMAVAYTLLGLIVAAAGLQFQAALQHPYILITLAVIFVLLALSMFGLFNLQLPSALQTRLTLWSNTQQGGSLFGVFAMGALAGLICSPCTTAPLSAILLYIAQSGNLLAGGGTLYLYALGMGIPLILVTLFGHRLLPRSGPWMQYVKQGFGFIILALPVFLLERVLGDNWGLRLWSLLGIAFFGWGFVLSLKSDKSLWRGLSILLLAASIIVARPLQDWAFPTISSQPNQVNHLPFQAVSNLAQLEQRLPQAAGKTVMLDLYADWCVACKEFEKYTFSDPQVQQALSQSLLLQADVTANNAEQRALLKQLQVLGLPTILFFNTQGEEIPDSRVTGFMDANQFRAHLQKVLP